MSFSSLPSLLFVGLIFLQLSVFANEREQECIEGVKEKYGEVEDGEKKKDYLREIKKCQQRFRMTRYEQYFNICKSFRLQQNEDIEKAELAKKMKQCRLDAELYEKSVSQSHLTGCTVKPCVITDTLEMCLRKYTNMGNVGVADCRKLFAPMGCMVIPKDFAGRAPTTVFWESGSAEGEVTCSEI